MGGARRTWIRVKCDRGGSSCSRLLDTSRMVRFTRGSKSCGAARPVLPSAARIACRIHDAQGHQHGAVQPEPMEPACAAERCRVAMPLWLR